MDLWIDRKNMQKCDKQKSGVMSYWRECYWYKMMDERVIKCLRNGQRANTKSHGSETHPIYITTICLASGLTLWDWQDGKAAGKNDPENTVLVKVHLWKAVLITLCPHIIHAHPCICSYSILLCEVSSYDRDRGYIPDDSGKEIIILQSRIWFWKFQWLTTERLQCG